MFYNLKTVAVLIILFLSTSISAQEVGEIFTKQKADDLFGEVLESYSVSTSTVIKWLSSTNDKIMFLLKNGTLTVLGDDRDLVYSTTQYSETNEVFHLCSKSRASLLLDSGGNSITYIENRTNVLTITNGSFTLEKTWPCPPYCDNK